MKNCFWKYLLVFAFALQPWSAWAEDVDFVPLTAPYDFLAVNGFTLKTNYIFEHGNPVSWEGEGLHAGIQSFSMSFFNCKEIPEDMEVPANPLYIFEIKDMEGRMVARHEQDLTSTFRMLAFSDSFTKSFTEGDNILRGGKYKLTADITPSLFTYEREFTLPDEPGIQVFNTSALVDSLLCPSVILTGGYPYDPVEISGEKRLHWRLASAKSPETAIVERDDIFELKSDTPTLAAVDSLILSVDNLEPGEYIYTLSSDFAPANYSFKAIVNDVLNPEISLDKTTYILGDNEEAVVKVEMSYSYPYVGAPSASSSEPTVTVCAGLLGEETSESYSDAAWADSDMRCTAEIRVPLAKVTEETVKEYEGEIPLNISIKFNDVTKFHKDLPLKFETTPSGIGIIEAEESAGSATGYFNILGIEVDKSYRGLVITSDGRKIIR